MFLQTANLEGIMGKDPAERDPFPHSYLSVGLLGDVNVLGSI